MWMTVLQGLLDLLWPPLTECLLCQERPVSEGCLICQPCWDEMSFASDPEGRRCSNCSRPMLEHGSICAECAEGQAFGQVWALGYHRGALREAIHHLKFNGRDELGIPLGRRLGSLMPRNAFDLIVPVPLHPTRQRERGYNQAALISKGIAEALAIPVAEGRLIRLRSTGHQAKLYRQDRLQNLTGAFGVAGCEPPWAGRSVLLVDDVLTTGATASAAAGPLWSSGAGKVSLGVLAVSTTPVAGKLRNTH